MAESAIERRKRRKEQARADAQAQSELETVGKRAGELTPEEIRFIMEKNRRAGGSDFDDSRRKNQSTDSSN